MPETKHAPGPWSMRSRDERDGVTIDIVSSLGTVVAAGVCADPKFYVEYENTANARLVAAAPELLEALKESQESIGGDWRARRDALIAKVEGRE